MTFLKFNFLMNSCPQQKMFNRKSTYCLAVSLLDNDPTYDDEVDFTNKNMRGMFLLLNVTVVCQLMKRGVMIIMGKNDQ